MSKIRLAVFILTLVVVGTIGTLVFMYARGYRFDPAGGKISANGLLVIKSAPDSAQVFLNGKLKTATNATISLVPGSYDVRIEKEGYLTWSKRLVIDKEIVTEATAHLFKAAPSLSAITFSGSVNPVPSHDLSKIAYVVPPTSNGSGEDETSGLWVMEMLNLPLGFARDPRRITDGDLTAASFRWSPDSRQILLATQRGVYLLDSGQFTSQAQRINVTQTQNDILADWEVEKDKRTQAQVRRLPDELKDILDRKASHIVFSPDEDMVLYTASGSATLPDNLIKQIPGSSTQKQERNLENGHTYVYDIKEDRNFVVDTDASDLIIEGGYPSDAKRRMSWFPTSRHLILASDSEIAIFDYDGTNRQKVYSGAYATPLAFPTLSIDRIVILTNLGSDSSTPNLYSVSIK